MPVPVGPRLCWVGRLFLARDRGHTGRGDTDVGLAVVTAPNQRYVTTGEERMTAVRWVGKH